MFLSEGNSFVFPDFEAKIQFTDDENRMNLFAFNPKFEVSRTLIRTVII